MSLNTKIFLFLLVANFSFLQGQEIAGEQVENEEEVKADPETVFFNLELFRPVAIGNYALARDYFMGLGVALDFNWFVLQEFTLGTHASITGGYVKDPTRIGNIESTTIYLVGLDIGYYHAFDDVWNIHATAGLGVIDYRHRAPEDKFSEPGNSYWTQVQVGYRVNRTVAFYFKLQPRYDKLNIAAPPSVDRYINNQVMINTGIGFKINLQNPGG